MNNKCKSTLQSYIQSHTSIGLTASSGLILPPSPQAHSINKCRLEPQNAIRKNNHTTAAMMLGYIGCLVLDVVKGEHKNGRGPIVDYLGMPLLPCIPIKAR